MKLFGNHGGTYRFRRKFKKDSGEINPIGVHRNMIISNCQMFVYYFVNSDLRVKIIFRRERTEESGGFDFEIVDIDTSAHWY